MGTGLGNHMGLASKIVRAIFRAGQGKHLRRTFQTPNHHSRSECAFRVSLNSDHKLSYCYLVFPIARSSLPPFHAIDAMDLPMIPLPVPVVYSLKKVVYFHFHSHCSVVPFSFLCHLGTPCHWDSGIAAGQVASLNFIAVVIQRILSFFT